MAFPGKREDRVQKVDPTVEAERFGLTTVTLMLRTARPEIDRADPTAPKVCQGTNSSARQPELPNATRYSAAYYSRCLASCPVGPRA